MRSWEDSRSATVVFDRHATPFELPALLRVFGFTLQVVDVIAHMRTHTYTHYKLIKNPLEEHARVRTHSSRVNGMFFSFFVTETQRRIRVCAVVKMYRVGNRIEWYCCGLLMVVSYMGC